METIETMARELTSAWYALFSEDFRGVSATVKVDAITERAKALGIWESVYSRASEITRGN